ncbi:MAG: hypothetical protein Q4E36_01550 [Bacillota bacterium]|nr:hypothetical protein [Bacillota bacterium]
MMNKKVKNLVLYLILLLILFLSSLSPLFGKEILWKEKYNKTIPFAGIYFDIPTNVANLKIRRSETEGLLNDLISYDVEFEYTGVDSSMRILGKTAEQSFFGDTVVPKHSKATLKGEYDKINNLIFDEKLNYGDLHKNVENYKFVSTSEIRVPLAEAVKNYKFRITYEPKRLVYDEGVELSKVSVFLTNSRVDNFTDGEYINASETQSFNESGMYVNVLEIYDGEKISSMNFWHKVNNVLFILSVILVLALIWFDRLKSPYLMILAMMVSILTFFRFFELGVSVRAVLIAFPIFGFLDVIVGRQTMRDKFAFNKYDFSQGLLGALLMFFLAMIVYLLPKLI